MRGWGRRSSSENGAHPGMGQAGVKSANEGYNSYIRMRFSHDRRFHRRMLCGTIRFHEIDSLHPHHILSLWIAHAPAQSAALIGLHVFDADNGTEKQQQASYRTFLITFRDGKAQLAADVPDLIVPRKDGFWRVGTLHKGPPGEFMGQEFVYAGPARSVPRAEGEYHPENPDWNCSETDRATIEFVNPDLLSVSYVTEPACSWRKNTSTERISSMNSKRNWR